LFVSPETFNLAQDLPVISTDSTAFSPRLSLVARFSCQREKRRPIPSVCPIKFESTHPSPLESIWGKRERNLPVTRGGLQRGIIKKEYESRTRIIIDREF